LINIVRNPQNEKANVGQPVSVAKLTCPVPSQAYPRSRLFDRLDEAAPVTWVSAPAGSGKTTLVSSFAKERRLDCIWYQLDAGDADPATFFHYLGLAARQASPRQEAALPNLTPEYLLGIETFARRFFEQFFAQLAGPAALVIDNYQEIPESCPVHALLRIAAESLPANLRLIVMSRAMPPAAFSRLRLNGVLRVLDGEELRLTLEEAAGIAALRLPGASKGLPLARIERLHAKVEGWAAGLVLLLEQASASSYPGNTGLSPISAGKNEPASAKSWSDGVGPADACTADLTAATQKLLFDYFAGEIFDTVADATQTILMRTAFFPHQLTAGMAVGITGSASASQVLADLLQRNFFIVQRAQNEPAYEYHPLFRDFLLTRARQAMADAEFAAIQQQAAALLEQNGQVDEAAELYLSAGDHKALSRLALSHAQALLTQGRNQTLLRWLSASSPETSASEPWLLYWHGLACMPFDQPGSRAILERAYAGFQAQDDLTGLYLAWAGVMDTFNLEWHCFQPVDRWIEAFVHLQARHSGFPSPEIELRVHGMLMATIYRQPQNPQLPEWAARTLHLLQFCTDANQGMQAGSHLLHFYVWEGDMFAASRVMEVLTHFAGAPGCQPVARIMGCALGGVYYWGIGNPKASLEQITAGLDLARATGMHVLDSLLYAQGVYANLVAGDLPAADELLRKVAASTRTHAYLEFGHFHFLSALVAQQKGDFSLALEHGRQTLAMTSAAGSPYPEALGQASLARSMLELGESLGGEEHLCRAHAIDLGTANGIVEQFCLLIEARTDLERGEDARGLARLQQALALGREHGRYAIGWWGPAIMAKLYVRALEAGVEVMFVQELIRRLHVAPPDPPTAPENWPWPLKVCTLGRFSVEKDGVALRSTGKGQKKPLELLRCIIALGGSQVPEEHVADLLWPETEGDAAYRALITTLQRLRQWLGHPEALELSGGCLSLNPKWVWADDWQFERLLNRHESLGPSDLSAGMAEKAFRLYRGPFLAGTDQPWAVSRREKLRAKFIHHLVDRGKALETEDRWQDAIACYLRGIDADEHVEIFHQQLIHCYRQQGRTEEAQDASDRRTRVAAAALGTTAGQSG
jgi:ATP/maltotriose-dependent transcriptional regulator MalT/DNA-binding SARP family transcriptional activator